MNKHPCNTGEEEAFLFTSTLIRNSCRSFSVVITSTPFCISNRLNHSPTFFFSVILWHGLVTPLRSDALEQAYKCSSNWIQITCPWLCSRLSFGGKTDSSFLCRSIWTSLWSVSVWLGREGRMIAERAKSKDGCKNYRWKDVSCALWQPDSELVDDWHTHCLWQYCRTAFNALIYLKWKNAPVQKNAAFVNQQYVWLNSYKWQDIFM